MTSSSFKVLTNPVRKILCFKYHNSVSCSNSVWCKKIQWGPRTCVRNWSSDSHPNIIPSTYPEIKLPEMPMHEYIFENLGQWENKTAIECGATGKKITYNQLYKWSKNIAAALQNKFNFEKGDRQAVVLPNCPEYAALFLAGSMAGAVSSTFNPIHTATEISVQLKTVKPKILHTIPDIHEKCLEALKLANLNIPVVVVKNYPGAETPSRAVDFAEIAESTTPVNFNPMNINLDDDLVIPFSSGTSGLPKGVQLSHKNIIANLAQFASGNYLKSNPNKETNQSIILALLPMFHIYGMVIVTFDALRFGAKLISLPAFKPDLFTETIHNKKTEILYLAPPLIFFLANQPMVKSEHLKYVQHIVNGAAPCGSSDIEKLIAKASNLDFCQGYGMTETSPVIAMSHSKRFHKTSSVGHPLALTLVKIADLTTGEPLPIGSHGEICTKGPQVMKGYLDRPEETKNTFDKDGWLKTGDVGYCDDELDLYVVDRLKELIKVKGFQVAPAELEEILRSHPKIADAGVIGVKHPELGEAPKAFVVLKKGMSASEEEIKNFIKDRLSPYKQLKGGVCFIKAVPKSSAGKILRKDLKTMKEDS